MLFDFQLGAKVDLNEAFLKDRKHKKILRMLDSA